MPRTEHLPPHDTGSEQALLGSLLIDRDAIIQIAPRVQPGHFFTARHQTLYRALVDLYWRRIPADLVTVVAELERAGALDAVGGEAYLAELIAATPTAVHAGYYAQIVVDHWTRRQIITAGTDLARIGYDASLDVADAVTQAEAALGSAVRGYAREGVTDMDTLASAYLATIDAPPARPVLFGARSLDELVDGIRPGDIAIVAARTGFGKTAFAMQAAVHNAKAGRPVGFVSLEMGALELMHRVLAIDTGIDSRRIRAGGRALDEHERWMVEESANAFRKAPLYIDAHCSGKVEDLVARARNLHASKGLDLLVVDYLQLLSSASKHSGRTQEVDHISRSLKLLAMELEIPIIAVCQLSRAVLSRSDPTPMLSDLRESGGIEQDANLVVFIHRPGEFDDSKPRELAHLIVAKHRSGPVGRVSMRFEDRTTRFFESRREIARVA